MRHRRDFLKLAGAGTLAAPFLWRHARAAAGRVAIIGGGAGGATLARALATSGTGIEVTLVEPKARYTTCFFSNKYLAGLYRLESLTFDYRILSEQHGVRVLPQEAESVDPVRKTVRLSDGEVLSADRIVLSPGIDFRWDAIEGYDAHAAEAMPHAWRAGRQSELLRRQLVAMEDGGVFLVAPPEEPYRCPSGPYERVSLVAHYFSETKPKSKIIILDAKNDFPLQAQFEEGWARYYPGMIEVIPVDFSGGLKAVDTARMAVMSDDGRFAVAVANIIPPQHAGGIARESGLADESGWCPVVPGTFESRLAPGIHVIGDAANAAPMPKAGYVASLAARYTAAAILREMVGKSIATPPLAGACWSYLTPTHAVRDYAEYALRQDSIERTLLDVSPVGEDEAIRATTADAAIEWYRRITVGMFG